MFFVLLLTISGICALNLRTQSIQLFTLMQPYSSPSIKEQMFSCLEETSVISLHHRMQLRPWLPCCISTWKLGRTRLVDWSMQVCSFIDQSMQVCASIDRSIYRSSFTIYSDQYIDRASLNSAGSIACYSQFWSIY